MAKVKSGVQLRSSIIVYSITNIRLGWKCLKLANTLAYFIMISTATAKGVIIQTPDCLCY